MHLNLLFEPISSIPLQLPRAIIIIFQTDRKYVELMSYLIALANVFSQY